MVGLFFYINSKTLNFLGFLYYAVKEENAEQYGDFLNASKGHNELFDERFKNTDVEYFNFPRGRVVYDTKNKKHIMYYDMCLKNKIQDIAALFELGSYILAKDEHYVCRKCLRS